MKFRKTIGVLLLLSFVISAFLVPCNVSAADILSPQEFLDRQLEEADVNGVAYVTKNGKVIAQSTRGMANKKEGKEVNIDTLFPIGSNSKQFCSVAVFMLIEQGKLSLDDTLSEYFPEYEKGADITVRQLLTMRSGVRDFQEGAFIEFTPVISETQQENQQMILDWLNTKRLKFKPGGGYDYSNTNYLLLSMIIEQITGESYESFIKENIFTPLGMENSGFFEELRNHPELCENAFPDVEEFLSSADTRGCFQGSGDVVSNAKDMDKWLTSLREYKLISKESTDLITTVCTTSIGLANGIGVGYAYGFKVTADKGIGHTGFVDTYLSGTFTYFEDKVNLFVVTSDEPNMKVDTMDLTHKIASYLKDTKMSGDVTLDMEVNVKDATMIQKTSAELVILDENEILCANVNGDTDVNIKDATAIQKYVALVETNLPIGGFFC